MTFRGNILIAALLTTFASAASAATVQNGGFEEPGDFTANWRTYGSGSSALTGWDITRGSIDHINLYWEHSEGNYSIDLDGSATGTISQTIDDLIVGQSYALTFDLASNGTDTKSVTASIGQTSQSFSFDGTGTSYSNMGWLSQELSFVAEDTSLLLSFASDSQGRSFRGVALDNIQIAAVPLPASLPMMLLGLAGAAAFLRRKQTT